MAEMRTKWSEVKAEIDKAVFAVPQEEGEDLIRRHPTLASEAPIIPPVRRCLEARDRIRAKAQAALDLQDVRAVLPRTCRKGDGKKLRGEDYANV